MPKLEKKLSSGTQFVNVALPTAGKNQTIFLALEVSILKLIRLQNYIKSGESLDLNVSVYGNGNVLFSLPKPIVPAALNCISKTHRKCANATGMIGSISDICYHRAASGNCSSRFLVSI
jgi:hypothetical protein